MNLLHVLPLALPLANPAPAQDLVTVSPAIATVEHEDAAIRVIRSHDEPGADEYRVVLVEFPGGAVAAH